ncbi:MAG: hypothetical protein HS104_09595 [Polyangiaceae bacterium]|nr:hypothetical protein [Polyangiaceae bacterium]MCE7890763.1 hypothetical protein [Sorangiineae bacterium PRO1]MCL4754340.1 hypothetical protein [Myxococcales bacterium]
MTRSTKKEVRRKPARSKLSPRLDDAQRLLAEVDRLLDKNPRLASALHELADKPRLGWAPFEWPEEDPPDAQYRRVRELHELLLRGVCLVPSELLSPALRANVQRYSSLPFSVDGAKSRNRTDQARVLAELLSFFAPDRKVRQRQTQLRSRRKTVLRALVTAK